MGGGGGGGGRRRGGEGQMYITFLNKKNPKPLKQADVLSGYPENAMYPTPKHNPSTSFSSFS